MKIQPMPGFILRKIGPQYMAVPYGAATARVGGMITLSESAYRLWRAVEAGADTPEALVACLTDTYDVEPATARRDVTEFIESLIGWGAVAV